jgi:tRNA-dihydrouridine synthase 1
MKDEKLENFYRAIGESKLVVAPMVEQSELAWRILSRKFGAELTFTPMFHAKIFNESLKYRQEHFRTHYSDSPLIVQFCANDPSNFVKAAQHIQEHSGVLAVDLNLGCPQHIARKGHYGSYLQDDWETIHKIVSKASKELTIPVTCKIRVFEDEKRTIEYAQMLEKAGCKMLTVHGRKREQKGHLTGLADWKQIMNVKNSVKIPVFANGNILYNEDIEKCIKQTNVDGVMSAEGNLYNPAIFQVKLYANWYLADEYLKICESFEGSATFSQAKAHLFKIFHAR